MTVKKMVYARVVDVRFNPGKREEGLDIIANVSREVRDGFEGMLVLLSTDDEDKATYVTLWDSEDAMTGSWMKINPKATQALEGLLAEPVSMRSNEVQKIQRISIPVGR
ncbi:MAG: antibiotic biosynthesis monooxygenase [Methanomassiliicoccus sp.]|nr:antibiotic biosynthesis monooxygenase [Methanomassiliicoccus sp.]